jgi:hypothetical protein
MLDPVEAFERPLIAMGDIFGIIDKYLAVGRGLRCFLLDFRNKVRAALGGEEANAIR